MRVSVPLLEIALCTAPVMVRLRRVRFLPLLTKKKVSVLLPAIVTPPDVMSQLFLAIPLCLLFEIGLLIAPLFVRATKAPDTDPSEA